MDNVVPISAGAVAARAALVRGWHGMTARDQAKWKVDDWNSWGELADEGARLVNVVRGSPAWLCDMRSGAWVRSIDGISLDDFEICGGAVGRVVEVCAYIKGLGTRTYKFALVEKPSDRAKKAPPTWRGERPVPPGENVSRRDRLRYLEFAARHPYVRRHVWLLSELLKREWYRGIIPRHATIAAATGCSIDAVKLSQACCQRFGFLRVTSGKKMHTSNKYEVTWPFGSF